jgi:WD40 repeat protein
VGIYERTGLDTFTRLSDPASIAVVGNEDVTWTPDGEFLTFAGDSGIVTTYQRSGTAFTLIDSKSVSGAYSAKWSPDGKYLAVGHGGSPYLTVFERDGTTITSLGSPASVPSQLVWSLSWSSDQQFLAAGTNGSPDFALYLYQTDQILPDSGIVKINGRPLAGS